MGKFFNLKLMSVLFQAQVQARKARCLGRTSRSYDSLNPEQTPGKRGRRIHRDQKKRREGILSAIPDIRTELAERRSQQHVLHVPRRLSSGNSDGIDDGESRRGSPKVGEPGEPPQPAIPTSSSGMPFRPAYRIFSKAANAGGAGNAAMCW